MATSGLGDDYRANQPMRIQVRQGSEAEQQYYHNSSLPKGGWPKPKPEVIAPGISPKPLEDLLYHGGKIVPQMQFQNIYLGGEASWQASDIEAIDLAITLAMQHSKLNNVIKQYFVDLPNLSCDPRHSTLLEGVKPEALDEPDDVRDAIETGENHFLGWTSAQGREIGDQPVFVARPLSLVFQEIAASSGNKRIPVQLMYSNAVHGAEGPISQPH